MHKHYFGQTLKLLSAVVTSEKAEFTVFKDDDI